MLHTIAATRLGLGRLTVVDATNVQPDARKPLVGLAREHHVLPVAIVLDVRGGRRARPQRRPARPGLRPARGAAPGGSAPPVDQEPPARGVPAGLRAQGRRRDRRGRDRARAGLVGPHRPARTVRPDRRRARLRGRARRAARRARLRDPMPRACDATPTAARWSSSATWSTAVPTRRRCSALAMAMSAAGTALCVPGNHEVKLLRALRGRNVQITHGLAESLEQLDARTRRLPRGGRDVPRRARQPRGARRRQARGGARRAPRADARPRVGRGQGVRALRRDDRRDRRVRAPGAVPVGDELPRRARWSCTATPRCPSPSGSTTRSASTPAACSAAR